MKRVNIIQTADIHGRIHDYAYIAAYIDRLRRQGEPLAVVDCGDIFRGHILSEISSGTATAEIMNLIGYDCMVFGNDEHFKDSSEINAMRARLSFPVLGALSRQEDGSRLFDPWCILEAGGFKIGIIGFECCLHPGAGKEGRAMALEELNEDIPRLKEQGCDLLMVISHQGVEDTYPYPTPAMAADCQELDIIADGHSHHPLPEGITVGRTLVTQPGDRMSSFVHIVVQQRDDGSIEKSCKLIIPQELKKTLAPNEAVQKIIDRESEKVEAQTVKLGETPWLLDGGRPQIRQRETNLGDIVCDAMIYHTGAQLAIIGGGCIRAGILPGAITGFDIDSVFANGGQCGLCSCKGSWLYAALEHSLADYPTQTTAFLQVGGINILFDSTAQPGSRIRSLKLYDGTDIDPEKFYTVAKEIGGPGGPGGPGGHGAPGGMPKGPGMHDHQQESEDSKIVKKCGMIKQALIAYLQSGEAQLYEAPKGRIKDISEPPALKA